MNTLDNSNNSVEIPSGTVHQIPEDLMSVLTQDTELLPFWQPITPLARNEWICWVIDAKKQQTRQKRIGRLIDELKQGKRRPCCWPGCPHREKTGR